MDHLHRNYFFPIQLIFSCVEKKHGQYFDMAKINKLISKLQIKPTL